MLLGRSLGGILCKYLKLMDLSIYSLHNSALEAPFGVFSHVFVYMSYKNNNLPNTCGTRSVVNAYVFKFVNLSPSYVLIGGRIWSLRTANTSSVSFLTAGATGRCAATGSHTRDTTAVHREPNSSHAGDHLRPC